MNPKSSSSEDDIFEEHTPEFLALREERRARRVERRRIRQDKVEALHRVYTALEQSEELLNADLDADMDAALEAQKSAEALVANYNMSVAGRDEELEKVGTWLRMQADQVMTLTLTRSKLSPSLHI